MKTYEIDPADIDPEVVPEAECNSPSDDFAHFLFSNEDWMEDAECRRIGMPLDVFFLKRGGSTKLAQETCAVCPVKIQCLEYADRSHTEHGIWGGVTRKRGGSPRKPRIKKE